MYDPLALDRSRVDADRLRRRIEQEARHPRPRGDKPAKAERTREPLLTIALTGLHLRPRVAREACADC